MSYVAFLDMLGTREAANMSSDEYHNALIDFHGSIAQVSPYYDCKIYGYSDNAYVEFQSLGDVIDFFRILRKSLIQNHRYFSAAVDIGVLDAEKIPFKKYSVNAKKGSDSNCGYSMIFTSSSATKIYVNERNFCGIGVSLSREVVDELSSNKRYDDFCKSVYIKAINDDGKIEYQEVYDISYDGVSLSDLYYITSDFVVTSILSKNASRYYVTPIISMIKRLKVDAIKENLYEILNIIVFEKFKDIYELDICKKEISLICIYALLDYILSLPHKTYSIDKIKVCEEIIKKCNYTKNDFLLQLPLIPTAIISNVNKQQLVSMIYHFKQGKLC